MRRTTAAAENHAETTTALIDRLSAEYDGDLFADLGDGYDDDAVPDGAATGRHRRGVAATTAVPGPGVTGTGTTSAIPAHRSGGTAATAVVARHGASATSATAAVSRHAAVPHGRSTVRRLAPLGVGAAVMLVATLVIAVIPKATPDAGPELNSQLASGATIAPASPTAGGYLDSAASAVPTTVATPGPTSAAAALAAAAGAAKPKPVTKPAPKPASAPRAGTAGDGTQAAAKNGWQQVGGDEFNGTSVSGNWGVYEGAGHDGNGRRVRSAVSVGGGMLTISGNANGDSGGMSWNDDQTYGKWEVRARFPKGDDNYHPVLLLWPQNGWPPEVDFSETTAASDGTNFYLHYDGGNNRQVSASKTMDITQWHNYAVEWVNGRVTGFIDGVQWFESTDGNTVPNQPMHLAIQLDNFKGGGMQPTEMDVDYVRIYK